MLDELERVGAREYAKQWRDSGGSVSAGVLVWGGIFSFSAIVWAAVGAGVAALVH